MAQTCLVLQQLGRFFVRCHGCKHGAAWDWELLLLVLLRLLVLRK